MKFSTDYDCSLTDKSIAALRAQKKPTKHTDGHGLYLRVQPSGAKLWRFDYRYNGTQRTLALGSFPDMKCKQAREAADAARAQLKSGRDPWADAAIERRIAGNVLGDSFADVAQEVLDKMQAEGCAPSSLKRTRRYAMHARSLIGPKPVCDVAPIDVAGVLMPLIKKGQYTSARGTRSFIERVWFRARATGRVPASAQNPAPKETGRDLIPSAPVQNRAAVTDESRVGKLLLAMDEYDGSPIVALALRLLTLSTARPGEVQKAHWSEFDLDAAQWSIPMGRMKMRRPHIVPLSRQAVDVLKRAKALSSGKGYVFPSVRGPARPISENTLNTALRSMGFAGKQTAHGWRSTFSTLANESGKWDSDVIEVQLAHVDKNTVRRAYNRAAFWKERVRLMQWWADKLDDLRYAADPLALPPERRRKTAA